MGGRSVRFITQPRPRVFRFGPSLVYIYARAGEKDKAVRSYKELFKKGFIIADALNILFKKLAALKKKEFAVQVLEAVIESGNGNNETRNLLNEYYK